MLHEQKVLVTIMTKEPLDMDTAEVEVLELLEPMTDKSHPVNAQSVHVVALEKVK